VSRDSITHSASSAERTETAEDLRQSVAIIQQTIMSPLKLQGFKCRNVMKWHIHHQPDGNPGTGSKQVAAYQFDAQ